jgi:hypothetical protein
MKSKKFGIEEEEENALLKCVADVVDYWSSYSTLKYNCHYSMFT